MVSGAKRSFIGPMTSEMSSSLPSNAHLPAVCTSYVSE